MVDACRGSHEGWPPMSVTDGEQDDRTADVVIVGGGPAGCAAAVVTARYGLETVVFDRGTSSLRRCAFLENFLGFPAGIDVETVYDLMHDHVAEAGADLLADLVESVDRETEGEAFEVTTQDGRAVESTRVVAASTYDADYLRGLDDDSAMFESHEHHGEVHEHFDRDYPDRDGRTPIDGCYVAGGLAGFGDQAQIAAGHGMTVGRTVLADARQDAGLWDAAATHYDWRRRRAALDHDWDDEAAWQQRFDDHRLPDDREIDDDRLERVRAAEIERVKESYLTDDEIAARTERAHRRLAAHLDDEVLLDAIDDETLRAYVEESSLPTDD